MQAIITAALWHDSNTSHVIVKPTTRLLHWLSVRYSNTSHVIVKQCRGAGPDRDFAIQIHPML